MHLMASADYNPSANFQCLQLFCFRPAHWVFHSPMKLFKSQEKFRFFGYMVFLLAAVYIIAILAVFLGPMMALQNILGSRKKELLRESNRYMEETFQEARQAARRKRTNPA